MELTDGNKNINPAPPPIEKSTVKDNTPDTYLPQPATEPAQQQGISDAPGNAPLLDIVLTLDNPHERRVTTMQLTIGWTVEYNDGTATSNNQEALHPLQLKSSEFDESTLVIVSGNDIAELQFNGDYQPETVTVCRWVSSFAYIDDRFSVFDEPDKHLADAIESAEYVESDGKTIRLNNDGKDYIYEVRAEWENGESTYTFRTIDSDINRFWTGFREAVSNRNYTDIAAFVNFPLETRGPLDSNPVVPVKSEEFEKCFSAFLETEEWDGPWYQTNYDFIDRIIYISHYEQDSARIGSICLNRINGEWKVVFIYVGEI